MAVTSSRTVSIAAPVETVAATARDVGGHREWWPGMLVSEVLERDVEGRCTLARIVDEVAKVGRDEFRLAYTHEDGSVSWHLVGRSRLQKSQAGSIRFRSLGEGSEATVALAIETTLPLPGFLQRQVVRGVDRGAAEGLRARCEGR